MSRTNLSADSIREYRDTRGFHQHRAPMHTFFHGWRRTAGCVALVVACALMALWMRSLCFCSSLTMPVASNSAETWVSIDGRLVWCAESEYEPPYQWHDGPPQTLANMNVTLDWTYFGFARGSWNGDPFISLSYWSIVLPLTLLSAYLLLWKPKARRSDTSLTKES
jgi:hypothetical protein